MTYVKESVNGMPVQESEECASYLGQLSLSVKYQNLEDSEKWTYIYLTTYTVN